MKLRVLLLLGLCMLLMLTLLACNTPDTPTTDETNNDFEATTEQQTQEALDPNAIASYTVYLPENASVWERKCAEKLITKITEATGVTLTLGRDEGARTECEILLTGNPAEAGFDAGKIGYNGYAVKREGNKLTLAASIENGMLAAIDYTLANVITDGKVAESCDVLIEQNIELVTPDPGKHINVTIDADTGYDIYQLPSILNSGYRYGASIIVNEDGTMDAWFAMTGCG
ncbi:MAG: hypothetical protein IIW17_07855, partial [Clostridia bacterium]|nr:hypothetical protein [Clostridia bacterium]